MRYTIRTGDTLDSIADRLTLSRQYASALAEINGLFEDDGVTPFNPYRELPTMLGTLEIPDNWLKTMPAGAPAPAPVDSTLVWVLLGFLVLAIASS